VGAGRQAGGRVEEAVSVTLRWIVVVRLQRDEEEAEAEGRCRRGMRKVHGRMHMHGLRRRAIEIDAGACFLVERARYR